MDHFFRSGSLGMTRCGYLDATPSNPSKTWVETSPRDFERLSIFSSSLRIAEQDI
jgi:hypothetical protein